MEPVVIAILLAHKLTGFEIIEQSARENGFDYYLGFAEPYFQQKALLEVSGIFSVL